jgi:N-acetylglucosaminyl-diphospho-decaprenol L-rhamnosyltransferase
VYRGENARTHARRTAGWLSGACLLVRKTAFDEVHGFDADYFMYFEDVDLGERLGRRGWSNIYVPESSVVHSGAHSTSKSAARMIAAHHRSAYRYLSRRYPAAYQAPLRWALRLGLSARRVIVVRRDSASS